MASFSRLVRFIPSSGGQPRLGEPLDQDQDVGLAMLKNEPVHVNIFSGSSILAPGSRTEKNEQVGKILSPLAAEEVGTIRCIGLNVSRL
jgi:hypothetical protein